MSFGRSVGRRMTVVKIERGDYGRQGLIEVYRHDLHPTKGWKFAKHFKKWISRKSYDKLKMERMYWSPAGNWKRNPKANQMESLETPLTRARHVHPRHMRRQAIVRAVQEMREAALGML